METDGSVGRVFENVEKSPRYLVSPDLDGSKLGGLTPAIHNLYDRLQLGDVEQNGEVAFPEINIGFST